MSLSERDINESETTPQLLLESNTKLKLTENRLKKFRAKDALRLVWDDEIRGFGVRVSPSGLRAFFLKGRVGKGGQQVWLTIGQFPEVSLDEARQSAIENRSLLRKGVDPRRDGVHPGQIPALRDFAPRYMEEYSRIHKKPKSQKQDEDFLRRFILPAMGDLTLDRITRADLVNMRANLLDRRQTANHLMTLMSGMFTQAAAMGVFSGENPAKGIKKFPMKSRDRFLSGDELIRLGEELRRRDAKSPAAADFFRLLLLTGARRGEIMGLSWEEVDLKQGVLRLRESKSGAKIILLPDNAVECLCRRLDKREGPWVFPGPDPKHHMKSFRSVWALICKRAGIQGLTMHDLRRSHATIAGQLGVGEAYIQRQLGHSSRRMLEVYLKRPDESQRAALNKTGAYLADVIC